MDDDVPDQEVREFFTKHCATPGGVIIVTTAEDQNAVFSSFDLAREWAKKQDQSCAFCPFVIDEPDFGNVPSQRQH